MHVIQDIRCTDGNAYKVWALERMELLLFLGRIRENFVEEATSVILKKIEDLINLAGGEEVGGREAQVP